MATAASVASVSSAARPLDVSSAPFSRLSRYSTPIRFGSAAASARLTYRTRRRGTQHTCRMPSAIVPPCSDDSSSSSRSTPTRGSPVAKTSSGNLRLVSKVVARQRDLVAAARQLELERAAGVGQHDEPALGAAQLDGRIDDQREHLVQHAARSERPQPIEKHGHLVEVGHDRRAPPAAVARRHRAQKTTCALPASPSRIASPCASRTLRDPLAVDEGPEARSPVAQDVPVPVPRDLRVVRATRRRHSRPRRCRSGAPGSSRPWRSGRCVGPPYRSRAAVLRPSSPRRFRATGYRPTVGPQPAPVLSPPAGPEPPRDHHHGQAEHRPVDERRRVASRRHSHVQRADHQDGNRSDDGNEQPPGFRLAHVAGAAVAVPHR